MPKRDGWVRMSVGERHVFELEMIMKSGLRSIEGCRTNCIGIWNVIGLITFRHPIIVEM